MMTWLAVGFGGAVGAVLRYGIVVFFGSSASKFPTATFVANVLGCLVMGFLFALVVDKHLLSDFWRSLLMVGFLGALTTFSTFALEALSLWQNNNLSLALIYVSASVGASLVAIWMGYSLGDIVFRPA